jgi:hypothetical protein
MRLDRLGIGGCIPVCTASVRDLTKRGVGDDLREGNGKETSKKVMGTNSSNIIKRFNGQFKRKAV